MTVLELIEELTEVDELDVVVVTTNEKCYIYEGAEIEFIDAAILDLPVKHYSIRSKVEKRRKCRMIEIEC